MRANKVGAIIIIVLIISSAILGYSRWQSNAKVEMLMSDRKSNLISNLRYVNSALGNFYHDENSLYKAYTFQAVTNIEENSQTLLLTGKLTNDEYVVISSVKRTMQNLNEVLAQIESYYDTEEPFKLNFCSEVELKNQNEINEELDMYVNIMSFIEEEPLLNWDIIIENWERENKSFCDLRD